MGLDGYMRVATGTPGGKRPREGNRDEASYGIGAKGTRRDERRRGVGVEEQKYTVG